ncbi:uncharacterized protein BO66DRAFT_175731 [Aspergillus aculeatinus CBS 121060]|uniref:Uncharacterized protein n=1 Tax=Aspergillus aculeatinus CBS 121060 TaxID=1448322 RepID=A0ACD1HJR1_9EURO|nr:hypothetical protein BO66DRAFT_175731 [Aspergillus aculeatinus CBS 121060]RAH73912.1 hypothetical protein BO66DRAFT_175731 [Aspergillus aculeatinus CBS 121060]
MDGRLHCHVGEMGVYCEWRMILKSGWRLGKECFCNVVSLKSLRSVTCISSLIYSYMPE